MLRWFKSKFTQAPGLLRQASDNTRWRVGHNAFTGRFPHGEIGALVAGIIEAARPKSLIQEPDFLGTFQVRPTV